MPFYLRQPESQYANRRQKRAHVIDDRDAGAVGQLAKHGGAEPGNAERKPEIQPAMAPTRPGTSSCAKTMMAEKAEARMRPMMTVSTRVQNRLA